MICALDTFLLISLVHNADPAYVILRPLHALELKRYYPTCTASHNETSALVTTHSYVDIDPWLSNRGRLTEQISWVLKIQVRERQQKAPNHCQTRYKPVV